MQLESVIKEFPEWTEIIKRTRPDEFELMIARKDHTSPMKSIFSHKKGVKYHKKAIQDH